MSILYIIVKSQIRWKCFPQIEILLPPAVRPGSLSSNPLPRIDWNKNSLIKIWHSSSSRNCCMLFYIYIGLLQVGVEGEHNEAGVGLGGDDDEEDEENHKVYRIMQHSPEAQPWEPSCHEICHCEPWTAQGRAESSLMSHSPRATVRASRPTRLRISQIQIQTFWLRKSQSGFPWFDCWNKEKYKMMSPGLTNGYPFMF